MKLCSMILLFLNSLFLLLSVSIALDTLLANQAITDGNTIISNGEMFELGFFSPGNSKNRYVGIWYKKVSSGTVVWVANRETPIPDNSGMFTISAEGVLQIVSGGGIMIWSANLTGLMGSNNPVAQLLDTGNLVVWDENSTGQNPMWQSFDYPCDTLLPGMKFGKDLVTGIERFVTSWKSPDDPSPGLYTYKMNTNGYPQMLRWRGQVLQSRLGPWNGLGFSGFLTDIPNSIFTVEFVVNEKEIYHKYELISSVLLRKVLTWDGKTQILHWIERIKDWGVYKDVSVDGCDRFSHCGSYGRCSSNTHPPCTCIENFEPRNPKEWDKSDWSSGCKHKNSVDCYGDGFLKISRVKIPDTRFSWYNYNMTLRECEMVCKKNCSCTAYANLDIRNGGNGCLLWFDELVDIREFDSNQDLYIRVAASALEGHTVLNERKRVFVILFPIASVMLLLSALLCVYRKINRSRRIKGYWKYMLDEKDLSLHMEHLDDLQFYSLSKVARATDNFSISNKIGEGGFGPVYKGVFEDGQEVAVKRLSETSQQGLDEFKNEIICIAKLQHRNLVKLLGYCIYQNELILIYEYMINKSLDLYLFDETKSLMLDWPKRFCILHGMARGILYLHQDSRLQIIHRDLKAGNILLDGDMNPKISDFGLARKFVGHDAIAKTKKVVGTYGYISPEYAVHGRFSIKSDVFSFGVLVLEIVSGMKNREFFHKDHRDNLLGHAWRLYQEDKCIELMSASLRATCVVTEVVRSIHVALLCVQHHAEDRPTMLSVLLMLVSEGVLPQPKQPAFFTGESPNRTESVSSAEEESMITQMYGR